MVGDMIRKSRPTGGRLRAFAAIQLLPCISPGQWLCGGAKWSARREPSELGGSRACSVLSLDSSQCGAPCTGHGSALLTQDTREQPRHVLLQHSVHSSRAAAAAPWVSATEEPSRQRASAAA